MSKYEDLIAELSMRQLIEMAADERGLISGPLSQNSVNGTYSSVQAASSFLTEFTRELTR